MQCDQLKPIENKAANSETWKGRWFFIKCKQDLIIDFRRQTSSFSWPPRGKSTKRGGSQKPIWTRTSIEFHPEPSATATTSKSSWKSLSSWASRGSRNFLALSSPGFTDEKKCGNFLSSMTSSTCYRVWQYFSYSSASQPFGQRFAICEILPSKKRRSQFVKIPTKLVCINKMVHEINSNFSLSNKSVN